MGNGIPADAVKIYLDCGEKNAAPARRADNGWPFGCTEVRNLMAYDGKLFVGTGLWTDVPTAGDVQNPGCAIMRLDSGGDPLVIEHSFTGADTAVCLLHVARFEKPVKFTVPIASTWKNKSTHIYYRDYPSSSWHYARDIKPLTDDGTPQVRSAFNYTDPITGISLLFLGHSNGIYSLGHDPDARGGLGELTLELDTTDFPPNTTEKQAPARVMSFSTMSGKLYATIFNRLFERQNGVAPTWELVWEDVDIGVSDSGLRGLTHGGGDPGYFFVARTSNKCAILRLVPEAGGWRHTIEYDLDVEVAKAWSELYGGKVTVTYGIAGYNDMVWFQAPGSPHWSLFVGFQAFVGEHPSSLPTIAMDNDTVMALGCYLVFNFQGRGEWRLNHLPAVTSQSMVSCRVGCPAPFPNGTRFFIGGYDCNFEPSHNSGFLVALDMDRMIEGAIS
jgi:hypothetical protein